MKVLHLCIALVLTASAASAQSLGDLARKEAERRKIVQPSGKVFTNETLRAEPAPAPAPAPGGAPAAVAPSPPGQPTPGQPTPAVPPSPSGVQQPAPGDAAAPEAAAGETQGEAYWRDRMAAAREAMARAQTFAEALQTRINVLSADFASRDDPAQRSVVATDRQRALAELDRVKQEIAQHEKSITTIQDEARRAGVPAGWVR